MAKSSLDFKYEFSHGKIKPLINKDFRALRMALRMALNAIG